MVLVKKDSKGQNVGPYWCPECHGKTVVRKVDGTAKQIVQVNHTATCKTGIIAYNRIHRKENHNG